MKNYKFRAFDKRIGRMIQTGIQFSNTTMELDCIPDLILMQYTGLKDKKGKEIYEGDIIRLCEDGNCDTSVVVFNPHQASFMFRWANCWKNADDFMHADYPSQLHPDRVSREVIGNIYENPII